jgi:tetrahydromethanopterin S-methyltransferase subunit A
MSYKKQTDAKGVTRYKLDNRFVKAVDVPEDVKKALDLLEDGVEFDPSVIEELTPITVIEDEEDVDDESGIDEEVITAAPEITDTDGMGFPRVKGKTVDIFNGKPHEAVRFVQGKTVPLTQKNYEEKSDTEIANKLKEMGIL